MRLAEWRAMRLGRQDCTLCRFPVLLRFGGSEHAVRCPRCGANPAAMCLVDVLSSEVSDLASRHVYELSSRGPFFAYLQRRVGKLTCSEYFDDISPGDTRYGVVCQDVQRLGFEACSFDVCTSTDVFEHVPDDRRAFGELFRVLRPGGCAVFTVPLDIFSLTKERAELVDGKVCHRLPPEYHDDHIRGAGQVLCYRNYGSDIVDRVKQAGFIEAELVSPGRARYFGQGRHVVVARRD